MLFEDDESHLRVVPSSAFGTGSSECGMGSSEFGTGSSEFGMGSSLFSGASSRKVSASDAAELLIGLLGGNGTFE
jgi:hypothetical protein